MFFLNMLLNKNLMIKFEIFSNYLERIFMANDWLSKTFFFYTLLRISISSFNYFSSNWIKGNYGEKYTSLVSLQPNKFPLDEFSILLCVALTSFVFCFVKRKFGIQKYLETVTFEETVQTALTNSNKTMNSLEKILSRLNSLEKTVQLSTATIGDIIKCVKELEEKLIVLEREDGGWKNSYNYENKLVAQQVPEKDSNYSKCSLSSSLEQEDYADIKEKEIFEQLKELQESISKLRQQTKTIMSSPSSQKTVICSSSSKTNNAKIESPRPFYLSNVKYRQLSNIKTELVPTLNKVQSRINDIKSRNS